MSSRARRLMLCVALAGCGGRAASRDAGDAGKAGADGATTGADAPADVPASGDAGKPDVAPASDGGAGAGSDGPGAGGQGGQGPTDASPSTDAKDAVVVDDASIDGTTWFNLIPTVNQPALAAADPGAPFCYESGWCWSNPTPLGGRLAVWAGAADDVWVVGPRGATRHFDGKAWTNFQAPTTANLRAVAGAGPQNVWAAGDAVVRWDGAKWVAAPAGAGDAVAVRSPTEVWLGSMAELSHLDGAKWTVDVPRGFADLSVTPGGTVLGVIGSASVEVYAKPPGGPLEPLPTKVVGGTSSTSVWGTGTNDVWVTRRFDLMRWDGADLRTALLVPLSVTQPPLRHVRGSAANDVWVSVADGSMLHWDGARFQRWRTGLDDVGVIAARAANDVWVAGERGSLQHFEGTGWRPHFSGRRANIQAMARASADEVWAVGTDPAGAVVLRHRPATGWQEVVSPASVATFIDIWAAGPSDVWITGDTAKQVRIFTHWNGTSWTPVVPDPSDEGRSMVWGSAGDDVWATGAPLLHWNGTAWAKRTVDLHPTANWWWLHGSAKDNVWLLGGDGQQNWVVSWNGAQWTDRAPGLADVAGLFVRGRDDVFAWNEKVIRHFDGQAWTTIKTLPDTVEDARYLGRCISARAGELWASTSGGAVESWNGTTWTPSDELPNAQAIPAPTVLATENAVFLGGLFEGGGILRKPRP